MDRRQFLGSLAATGLLRSTGLGLENEMTPEKQTTAPAGLISGLPRIKDAGERSGDMLYRILGTTGEKVSAIGMGGFHIAKPSLDEATSIRLVHEAVDRGITFMDNCWDYNEGQSEIRMGKALSDAGRRDKVLLMTKIDGRTKEAAASQIETSLKRLKTDHIDLLQHHEILRFDDPDRIFAESGAMEAVLEAKQTGKIRFIGFTGHKDPHVHLYMLETAKKHGFHYDTAQMPLNVMDAHYRSFAHLVVPRLVELGTGVLGMKPFGGADGVILKSNTVQPLDCLHYAMNLPTSVVITGIDGSLAMNQAFEAAKTFKPLADDELSAILQKTAKVAATGEYEIFKTSAHFDTTAKHPDFLGGDSPSVGKLAPQNT